MSKLRVHELAGELGRQNKEVIEFLKSRGVEVKSHMSMVDEPLISVVKNRFSNNNRGKEHIAKLDTPKTEEKVVTAKSEGDKAETPKKKKNIIRVYHAQNASDGGKTTRKKPAKAEGERTGAPRNTEGKSSDNRTDGDRPRRNNGDRSNAGNRRPQGDGNRQGRFQGEGRAQGDGNRQGGRFGSQGRSQGDGQGRQGGRPQGDGNRQGGRFGGQGRSQGDGQGRQGGRFQGDGNRQGGRFGGQGRSQGDNRQGGRPQGNGQGRPDGNRSEGRDGRFGGGQGRQGQRQNTRKNDDMVFAPELTKTSKDSKRERDRENKNKKKDFDKSQSGGRRPNQGGFNKNSRIPKALQKPTPQPKQEEKKPEVKEITLPEKMTIRELAEAMKMQPSVIVKKLFMEGMMVTVNHEIDFEKAQEIALDYDIIAEKEEKVDVIEELLKEGEEDEKDMVPRPPVVCVMGHVDHGKTSLLDAIRKTNVTRGEAGGITQHIGASVVEVNGQNITFLDTPGHEAFTAMRMRGANSTDIAVLVVAADDGVMPQTVEAISHAKAAGVEIIVAINKIDKPSANIERVKQELSEYELIPEDWGGSTIFVPVSAHTGEGIDTLLEMILLTAEVCELKANPNREARGLVIEAQLDKGKGPVATILVQKGTLHVGDFIAAGACNGKVRAMMDDKGRRIKEAGPSTPVEILGLGDVPNAGEILLSFESDKEAKNFAGAFVSENKNRLLEETKGKLSLDNLFDQIQASDLKELPIIVKADVQGSVEAVKQSLTKLSNEEVVVKVIHGGVGAVNESDVSLAATSNAIIIGFNVRPDATAKQLAEQEGVDLRLYRVIYQAIEDVEAAMKGMLDPIFEEKVIGHAEVRQLFKASGVGTIAGSYILDGIFQRNCKVRISREGEQIFEGELASLKRFKDDVKEVKAGYECGLVFDGFNDVKEEDKVEAYIMVEVPR
ncbi:translation initiation factor IF-2 [Blautia sp.]